MIKLCQYPHLAKMVTPDFIASFKPKQNPHLDHILHDEYPPFDHERQRLNELLELAYRHGIVDKDFESKFRTSWKGFRTIQSELSCAKFLEGIFGMSSLQWHPRGQGGRIGEFELLTNRMSKPIFVEVKTIFPHNIERLEMSISARIQKSANAVSLPYILSIQINKLGDFKDSRFREFLNTKLGENSSATETGKLQYKDRRGLSITMKPTQFTPEPSGVDHCVTIIAPPPRTFNKTSTYIKHSLKKAKDQLPNEKPCLVILKIIPELPISEAVILNSLLGTLKYCSHGPKPEPFRSSDGFFSPRSRRRFSAVATYEEKFSDEAEPQREFKIYHNPWPYNPIDPFVFESEEVSQHMKRND